MHSLSEFGANVPAFLAKLWKLVDDPETNDLIRWSEEGTSFYIQDQAQFSRKLLPMYYKHNNMASFIRQLNMYGFHKIVSADAGSLRLDRDEMEFAHQCFLRGHPYLLEHIKRKSQMLSSKQLEESRDVPSGGVIVKAEFMNKMLNDVKQMRGRQDTVESRLSSMKQENEALWRELSLLRQKHMKQQNIVNKLIQFLVTLVQPSQRLSPKRRYPLMINSVAHPTTVKRNGKSHLNNNDASRLSPPSSGPTIHEIDPEALGDANADLLTSDTIPVEELSEAIDTEFNDPEVLSPESDVLDNFNTSLDETNLLNECQKRDDLSKEEEMTEGDISEDINPDILLGVDPADVNPSIVVPGLQLIKSKGTQNIANLSTSLIGSTSKPSYRTVVNPPTTTVKSVVPKPAIRTRAGANAGKVNLNEVIVKKEPKILPPRIRKKRGSSAKTTSNVANTVQENAADLDPLDLLAEAGLVPAEPEKIPSPINEATNDVAASSHSNAASPVVLFMSDSPIPEIQSPAPSPASSYSSINNLPQVTSPLASSTGDVLSPMCDAPSPMTSSACDATNPIVAFPESGNTENEQQARTSQTVSESAFPSDLTLACTSDAGSSSSNPPVPTSPSCINRCGTPRADELHHHIGTLDSELGQLKDLLNNSNCFTLDANALLGLFNDEDPVAYNLPMPAPDTVGSLPNSKESLPVGNELAYYQPSLMDFEDLYDWEDNSNSAPTPPPSSELNTPISTPINPTFPVIPSKKRKV